MTGGTDFHGLYTKTPYPLEVSYVLKKDYRLILAGEQANKAFYEKHPKFKNNFYKEESFFASSQTEKS